MDREASADVGSLDAVMLAAARVAAGLTQLELARRLRVPRSLVGHWETGRRPIPPEREEAIRRALSRRPQPRRSDPAMSLRRAAGRVIVRSPGLTRRQVVRQLGQRKGAAAAIAALLAAGEVHERWHDFVDERGAHRRRLGLYPGPADALFVFRSAPAADEGEALRREREALGLTRTELAQRAGVSDTYVWLWETGQRAPTPAHRDRIDQALRPSGAQLRNLRKRYGWSQRAAALALGVQPSSWCHWEGDKRPLSRQRWTELCAGLKRLGVRSPDVSLERTVDRLVEAVKRHEGRSRSFILACLNSPRGEAALARALAESLVHERLESVEQRGPHGERQRRMRLGLYLEAPSAAARTVHPLSGAELRSRRLALHLTQRRLADELGVTDQLVCRWERTQVPAARASEVRGALARGRQRDDEEIMARLETVIVGVVKHSPGLSRWELPRRIPFAHRGYGGLVSHAIARAVARGEVHERLVPARRQARGRTRIGLFPGPPPLEWTPAPAVRGRELARLRAELALTRAELGRLLDVSPALIATWEKERQPIPSPWQAELRRVLAPAGIAPVAGEELQRGRSRLGWSQARLGQALGVSQATISGWERGDRVPLALRPSLRALLAG